MSARILQTTADLAYAEKDKFGDDFDIDGYTDRKGTYRQNLIGLIEGTGGPAYCSGEAPEPMARPRGRFFVGNYEEERQISRIDNRLMRPGIKARRRENAGVMPTFDERRPVQVLYEHKRGDALPAGFVQAEATPTKPTPAPAPKPESRFMRAQRIAPGVLLVKGRDARMKAVA